MTVKPKAIPISCVYLIWCSGNNKFYGGSTKNLAYRKLHHLGQLRKGTHGNTHLQRTFNKYGEPSLTFEVAQVWPPEYVRKAEQLWLDFWKKHPSCMNFCEKAVGGGVKGTKASPETIQKLRNSHKGQVAWNKGLKCEYASEMNRERWQDPEYRARQIERLSQPNTPEENEKRAEARKNAPPRTCSEEAIENHRQATLKLWEDPVYREKVGTSGKEAFLAAAKTDEVKAKATAARAAKWQDPEWAAWMRKKLSDARQNSLKKEKKPALFVENQA